MMKTKKSRSLKPKKTATSKIQPIQALQFLEDLRLLNSNIDGPKKMISIRLPEKIIQSLKIKAAYENKKYQSLIIEAIKEYINKQL